MTHKLDTPIQNLIDEIIAAGDEVGLQVAAYLDGELIVDVWAGIADETTGVTAEMMTDWDAMCTAIASHEPLWPPNVTNAETMNRPDVRRPCIPGGGGIMNARAIARHYAMLAGRGELDGVRVLSAKQIDIVRALQVDTVDLVGGDVARRALGYGLGGFPEEFTGQEFGHGGLGGSQGLADIRRRLSFGLTKNLLVSNTNPKQNTAYRVAKVLLQHVG